MPNHTAPLFEAQSGTRETKVCRSCNIRKPLDAFYKLRGMKDGHSNICKVCKREYSQERRRKKAMHNNPFFAALSTRMAMTLLAEQGIPSIFGRGTYLSWTDLAAWGCVPIEAKLAHRRHRKNEKNPVYSWGFTPKQQEQQYEGFFMFVAIENARKYRVFIIPCDTNWLTEQGVPRTTGFAATLGSTRSENYKLLLPYENAYYLLENALPQWSQSFIDKMGWTMAQLVAEAL